jgi:hypothetical protein
MGVEWRLVRSFWGIKGSEDVGGGYKINSKLQGVPKGSNQNRPEIARPPEG